MMCYNINCNFGFMNVLNTLIKSNFVDRVVTFSIQVTSLDFYFENLDGGDTTLLYIQRLHCL